MDKPSIKAIEQSLQDQGFVLKSNEVIAVGGGSISDSYQVIADQGTYFLKVNGSPQADEIFNSERAGLKVLVEAEKITVPAFIGTGKAGNDSFILLSFLEMGEITGKFWREFGTELAGLHSVTNNGFGFNENNFIATIPQLNTIREKWAEFFVENRLIPLVRQARNKALLDDELNGRFDKIYPKIEEYFPHERPSLLHGDLWSGNFMCQGNGRPAIFDPAVYFGHREMDIAMSKLFGGFAPEFYHSYNDVFPLEKDWEERSDICNLYPLLVHLLLFGIVYKRDISRILRRFT